MGLLVFFYAVVAIVTFFVLAMTPSWRYVIHDDNVDDIGWWAWLCAFWLPTIVLMAFVVAVMGLFVGLGRLGLRVPFWRDYR